ncbi:hypothetical protein EVAR_96350_1 [Eumeta japonica]|uniref:Uncharacterized protein n=1 Tax=Eumeta variegata TaxID=151549 RepID=A0A4C1VVA1_EUMVA|nr:hypothetical protein EVAR_96350_1 [Eumeta japonica]
MTSRRALAEDEIGLLLAQEDENDDTQESDSEVEDHESKDDVQSDVEDEYIDSAAIEEADDVGCHSLVLQSLVKVQNVTSVLLYLQAE